MSATLSSATAKGGLFETVNSSVLVGVQSKSSLRRLVMLALGRKGMFMIRKKMSVLTGAVAGTSAAVSYGRIEANVELGGVRTIESETLGSGVSDAADVTEIKADFFNQTALTTFGASPVANLDGNPLGTR
jgi:hypothetical protein